LPESIRKDEHIVHKQPNNALSGDQILIECRKPGKWDSTRASEQHNYFVCVAGKNAYAVLVRKFRNVKD
jgi:hypothetical protein